MTITDLKAGVQEGILGLRARMNWVIDARWDNAPFGETPHASSDQYLLWHDEARRKVYPEIDTLEAECGFAVDRAWLDELALHTQIARKKSELGYPHGRLLYTLLRHRIASEGWTWVDVLETGTARGFSALCMARAIADAGVRGRIITLDVLSHVKPQIWNCIDDHEGPKSRSQILQPWSELLQMVTFIQADTLYMLPRLGLDRINFAFLDAQHIESSVLQEFESVASRQLPGDQVVFDDVTPAVFPGVVEAVNRIRRRPDYTVRELAISERRAYAWATRK